MHTRRIPSWGLLLVAAMTVLLPYRAACQVGSATGTDRAEVIAALAVYDSLLRRMDHDRLAATYTADGELADADQAPIRGPAAIRAHLLEFAAFTVLANRMNADSTRVVADSAWQEGAYWQRVRVPAGDTVEVSGRFAATWRRTSPGTWRIARMYTFRPPVPP